jgi:HD-GYP domain-containing protein (c-di-GMP phosphodiesterase class II)
LREVAAWAAYHHETLDGRGYPYSLGSGGLPREARIVAVADVFQAMAQDRPYRSSVPPGQILENLQQRAHRGQLDASVVELVAGHLDACWHAAIDGEHCLVTTTP